MNQAGTFHLCREKHLDHMVKVVPVIVFFYVIQSIIILKMNPTEFSQISLSALGGLLACMILGFITYDLKHQVILGEQDLKIHFFLKNQTISYTDISSIEIKDPEQSFSNLTIHSTHGKTIFYFVDEAEKIKHWIETRKESELLAA